MAHLATAVIIHWNQPDACLATVARFAAFVEVSRIIVVDNGSTPDSLRQLRTELASNVELIEVGHNSGFGPAANRGWERWLSDPSGTEWSLLAPHDALPDDDTVARLLEATVVRPRAGLLSADVGDAVRPVVDHVFGPISVPAASDAGYEAVDYPHGTLMMASRTCLTEIGLFDERYFAYCEEADLGLRAQNASYEVGLLRGAMVANPHVNTPAPIVDYLKERNTVLLVANHFGVRKALMRFVLTVFQFVIGLIVPSRRGEYWSTRARIMAIRDIVARRWGPPPETIFNLATSPQRVRPEVRPGR